MSPGYARDSRLHRGVPRGECLEPENSAARGRGLGLDSVATHPAHAGRVRAGSWRAPDAVPPAIGDVTRGRLVRVPEDTTREGVDRSGLGVTQSWSPLPFRSRASALKDSGRTPRPNTTLATYSHLWPDADDRTRAAAERLMATSLQDPADLVRTDAVRR